MKKGPSPIFRKAVLSSFRLLGLLLLMQVSTDRAMATHSMGADMTYTCLGNNTYKIRLSFYRDCSGIPAPLSLFIDISSVNCNIDTFALLSPIPGTGQEITPLCPSDISTCNGGVFTGIQEWVYEGIFTFPTQCTDWRLSYELCCRNGAITTIQNPLAEAIQIFSTLNNTICNNSPTFSNRPVPFVCMGQQFCFNHGAYDPDGDSLAYTLITPLSYFFNPVTYYPPYSPSQPLNSSPAMSFNYHTGDFCITPVAPEVTVMAVLVSEYRNGVLIGQVERDIQITVINCNNVLPTLSGIDGTNNFSATICADVPYCFNIFSTDPDATQNVTVSWDASIIGGGFNTSASNRPVGTFCWTPTASDAGGTPHCFTATVTDDACPFIGTQIYSYCFTVLDAYVTAGPDQTINCGTQVALNATGTTSYGSLTYQWSNGATTPGISAGPGTYIVTANNGLCSASDTVTVNALTGPVASFTAAPVCEGMPVTFTNSSQSSGATTWAWDFGDGATSSQQNPTHTYASPGTYLTRLIVNDVTGCPDTIMQQVVVNAQPTAAFSTGNACLGSSPVITNNSQPAGLTYSWDLGNGSTSSQTSPVAGYSASGTYTVSLTVTDAAGCSASTQQALTIYPNPAVSFNWSIPNPCPGNHVYFDGQSGPGISAWNWSFGNGQTSGMEDPDIIYVQGTYPVTLTVTSSDGCTGSQSQNITINTPTSITTSPPPTICVGESASISASGGLSYSWSNGQTTPSINVSPSATTSYTVSVTDALGCQSTAQVTVNVNPLPLVNAGPDFMICSGMPANLTASGAFSYAWSTGQTGQSITVNPASFTTYTVTGTDANGCSATDVVSVGINPNLVVTIPDQMICPGNQASLDAGFAGSTYQWSTGETTQVIQTSTAGNYSVSVTDPSGCTGSGQTNVTLGASPAANPTTVGTCMGHWETLDAGNPGCTYLWSNGMTTQTIPVLNAGNYDVTVTSADGCSITFTSTLVTNPIPTASFTFNQSCDYDTTYFTSTSSITSGSIVDYLWYFGDSYGSHIPSPNHFYGVPGMYTVKFTVTSDSGCIANQTSMVTISPSPQASFEADPVCLGQSTQFLESSIVIGDTINAWHWDFGDGQSSTSSNPNHIYSIPGSYPVQLWVGTMNGCYDTINRLITVNPMPVAEAGNDTTICSGEHAYLGSMPVGGTIYQWTPGISLSPTNLSWATFSAVNDSLQTAHYNYYLTATNQYGCTSVDSVQVDVLPVPAISFTAPGPQCLVGNSFDFIPFGMIGAGSNLTWYFFDDATPSVYYGAYPPPVVYSAAGNHPVSLRYSYGSCSTPDVLDTVIVWETPSSSFLPTAFEGCQPLTVTLYASDNQPGNQFAWTIQGNLVTEQTPSWTFTDPGAYIIKMHVTSVHGCLSEDYTVPINVYQTPVASFTHTPEVTQLDQSPITFTNESTGATRYEWDFGDGSFSDFFDGSHIYSDTGLYEISLIVITPQGCRDTTTGIVRVEDGFSFFVPNAFTPNDDGDNDYFQGFGTFIKSYEMWIYDRWGLMIYYTDRYDKPWDGRMKDPVQSDTYVYRIKVTDTKDRPHIYLGSVTLVR